MAIVNGRLVHGTTLVWKFSGTEWRPRDHYENVEENFQGSVIKTRIFVTFPNQEWIDPGLFDPRPLKRKAGGVEFEIRWGHAGY
jgi:hypothetical protein